MPEPTLKEKVEENLTHCKRTDIICFEPCGGYNYFNCSNAETRDGKCDYAEFSSKNDCKYYRSRPDPSECYDSDGD